jgi:hypothetical protein
MKVIPENMYVFIIEDKRLRTLNGKSCDIGKH